MSPVRGSECFVITSTCSSGENHCSDTILIGCSFPIAPAGISVVVRVPVAETPSIVCGPRLSCVVLPPASAILAGKKPPPSNVAKLPLTPRPPPGGVAVRALISAVSLASVAACPSAAAFRSSSREVTTTAPSGVWVTSMPLPTGATDVLARLFHVATNMPFR